MQQSLEKESFIKVRLNNKITLAQALSQNGIEIPLFCGGNGTCGKCRISIQNIAASSLNEAREVLACQFFEIGEYKIKKSELLKINARMNNDFWVVTEDLWETYSHKILEMNFETPIVIMDIGTTTVVSEIYYGNQKFTSTCVNPQRRYGADVMTRIKVSSNPLDRRKMTDLIRKVLFDFIEEVISKVAPDAKILDDLGKIHIILAGNTTMLHLFRGVDCSSLGIYPFEPKWIDYAWENMVINFSNKKSIGKVSYLPGISAFVGSDIVSGIYGTGMAEQEEVSLLVDLGTNGEMAIGNKERILVTSAAAGPAFEGSPLATVIYASGIMKLLHYMKADEVIDEYGTLQDEYFEKGYKVSKLLENVPEDLIITQQEIREIQMAKGAVAAGMIQLIKEYGITSDKVSKVYLAGGMGYFIDKEDAIAIGLLPNLQKSDIITAGNTALLGLKRYVSENCKIEKINYITEIASEIILSQQKDFQEHYIENMNF